MSGPTVGWWVAERYDPDADDDGNRRGGLVVDVESTVDPKTGEVVTLYLCVRSWRGQIRWANLAGDQLGPDASPPNASIIRSITRTAAGVVAARGGRGGGRPDDAADLQLLSLGCRLLAVIAPPPRG